MKTNKIIKIIFFIMLIELFIGGGGRLFEIGSLTLRMYVYAIINFISLIYLLKFKKIDKIVFLLSITFTFVILIAIINGYINNAEFNKIINDISPLLFFYSIIFFSIIIISKKEVVQITKLIKIVSFLMAVIYLLILLLLKIDILPFNITYSILNSTGEFFFRGEKGFFYKGFLYLCIGFIFHQNYRNRILTLLIGIAILMTYTRGFVFALIVVLLIDYIFFKTKKITHFFVISFTTIPLYFLGRLYWDNFKYRGLSDNIRILQIKQVLEKINSYSIFIGHGFGIGIPIRKEHMEISFLEIFHKQGIIGISFWILILFISVYYFLNIKSNRNLAKPFFLSVLFIYIQSFTNPFINNPIGMSMLLISLISLKVLFREENNKTMRVG